MLRCVKSPAVVIRVFSVLVDVTVPLTFLYTDVSTNIAVVAVSGCTAYVWVSVPTEVILELLVYLFPVNTVPASFTCTVDGRVEFA